MSFAPWYDLTKSDIFFLQPRERRSPGTLVRWPVRSQLEFWRVPRSTLGLRVRGCGDCVFFADSAKKHKTWCPRLKK